MNDLACHVSTADIASELDMDEVIEGCGINIDTLAEQVAERIADREGMQHLVSEELDAQGVSSVTTDAVESMIHTAIEQFADSLEVMVSAKLNINK
jgi:biotin-(acetyl-CoA carboxylase) ligase